MSSSEASAGEDESQPKMDVKWQEKDFKKWIVGRQAARILVKRLRVLRRENPYG